MSETAPESGSTVEEEPEVVPTEEIEEPKVKGDDTTVKPDNWHTP
ncbi:hypothetical protein ACFV3E_07695 [Streptomyces sp. NPDC059718]